MLHHLGGATIQVAKLPPYGHFRISVIRNKLQYHPLTLCRLLITFVNSLHRNQDQHSVDHDVDSNRLTL